MKQSAGFLKRDYVAEKIGGTKGRPYKPVRIKKKQLSEPSVVELTKKEDLSDYNTHKLSNQQAKHYEGTVKNQNAKEKGAKPSYVTITPDEVLDLVDKYKQTGINFYKGTTQEWAQRELILDNKKIIGYSVNEKTGKATPTSVFKIHYSKKNGVHIVPTHPSAKEIYKHDNR